MDGSLPGSSFHRIFQARVLEWVAISFSRRSSQPRDWTQVSHIVGRCFTIWATREEPKEVWKSLKEGNLALPLWQEEINRQDGYNREQTLVSYRLTGFVAVLIIWGTNCITSLGLSLFFIYHDVPFIVFEIHDNRGWAFIPALPFFLDHLFPREATAYFLLVQMGLHALNPTASGSFFLSLLSSSSSLRFSSEHPFPSEMTSSACLFVMIYIFHA